MPKPNGRPSKFKKEYCDKLLSHARNGQSFQSFADAIDVNIDTLHEWAKHENRKKYPGFSEAKKKARSAAIAFWEKHYINATIHDKESKLKQRFTYDKVLLIFAMKNMAGWTDKVESSVELENAPRITLKYNLNDKT